MANVVDISLVDATIYVTSIISACEWARNLEFEIYSIWPKSWCAAKWQYLCSRYLNLLGQIVAVIAANCLYSSPTPIPWGICFSWHLFTAVTTLFMFVLMEFMLAIQVRVLWGRKHWITIFLVGLVIFGFTTNIILGVWLFKTVSIRATCEIADFPYWTALAPGLKAVTLITLWTLVYVKGSKMRTSVLSTMMHVTSWSSSFLTIMLVGAVAHIIVACRNSQAQKSYLILYPIFMSATSIMNCRSIRQMHSHSSQSTSRPPSDNEQDPSISILTTIITDYWSNNSFEISAPR